MVPSRAVLRGSPAICHSLSWSDGTLCKGDGAVHGVCVELADAVEVEACAVADGGREIVS